MTIQQATLLVVDDEPILRTTFCIVLRQAGATVHTAENGIEALNVLAGFAIDAMLSDKQMPGMDGLTLLRTLAERRESVPTVLFVNGIEHEAETLLKGLGVVETVAKPLHPAELIRIFERVLAPLEARI